MEYLTTKELSDRIKMAPGTIRNLVWKRELEENVHFIRPTPRKLLFLWPAIELWLHRHCNEDRSGAPTKPKSLINI